MERISGLWTANLWNADWFYPSIHIPQSGNPQFPLLFRCHSLAGFFGKRSGFRHEFQSLRNSRVSVK